MPVIAGNEIDRYLRTGDYDPHFAGWPGNFMNRARQAESELRDALIAEVRRRLADPVLPEDGVDREEYVDMLSEAVSARNGWKRSLARCAPQRR